MAKKDRVNIKVNDLKVFETTVSALSKTVEAMKINIDQTGMKIYTRNAYARFHISSNCIEADGECELCINEIAILLKTLKLVSKQAKNVNDLTCYYDKPFLHFTSKDIKTKIGGVKERVIQNSLDQPITTALTPVFEFTSTGKTIKEICSNRFIFSDMESARVYLTWGDDDTMHKNVIYAELSNRINELSSSLVLPLGDITLNDIEGVRDVILDFDRLKVLNLFNCDSVSVSLMDRNILVSESQINGKEGIFTKLIVYNSMRKS